MLAVHFRLGPVDPADRVDLVGRVDLAGREKAWEHGGRPSVWKTRGRQRA